MNKKVFLFVIGFSLLLFPHSYAQINTNFFGQNAWYTWYTPYNQPVAANDYFVQYIADVKASGATYCRIGGANANILGNFPSSPTQITKQEILFLVKRIRDAGMEPIIQVPYVNSGNNNSGLQSEANNAADIVDFINNDATNLALIGGRVENWIIANEPDKDVDGLGHKIGYSYDENDVNSPANIAKYIKQFAIEMRKKDALIKITGPELAFPWHHFFFGVNNSYGNFSGLGLLDGTTITNTLNNSTNDISGLIGTTDELGNSIPGSIQGKPYIDYVSFHYYGTASSRNSVINNIHNVSDDYKVKKALINLQAACISSAMTTKRTSTYPLKVAVTEANLNVSVTIADTDPDSYLRGQWWCDFMSVCLAQDVSFINFWSSVETSFGFMKSDGTKRSTYHHFKMMADNFKGNFLPNTCLTSIANTKAFAYKTTAGTEIGVLIMNQNQGGAPNTFVINFNGSNPTSGDIKVAIAAGLSGSYSCSIKTESTILLKFNSSGVLQSRTEYNAEDLQNNIAPITSSPPNSADLYSRDTPTDGGTEPNPDTGPMWISEDIWVRNLNDGGTAHENPIAHPTNPNYVYVKVRNRGCTASSGAETLNLRWAKAATSLSWPNNWNGLIDFDPPNNVLAGDDINTLTIPAIQAGDYAIVVFTWFPPDPSDYAGFTTEDWHFCLLSRILSGSDPMFATEISDINANVNNNNNIAWKNLTVVDNIPGIHPPVVSLVHNNTVAPALIKLKFDIPVAEEANPFLNYGTIKVKLSPILFMKWDTAGRVGSDVEACGDSSIRILSPHAWIGDITLDSAEREIIKTTYELIVQPAQCIFHFDISQYTTALGVADVLDGGVRALLNTCSTSMPKLGNSNQGNSNQPKVDERADVEIYPNPNNGSFSVKYSLPESEEGIFEIYNLIGGKIFSQPVQGGNGTFVVSEELTKGIYYYRLISNRKQVQQGKIVVIN